MTSMISRSFSQGEWNDLLRTFQDLSLVQTWEYGEVKAQTGPWKVERAVFLKNGQAVGACQAMVRRIPYLGGGLVWINRAPLWQQREGADLGDLLPLLDHLRHYWVDEKGMYLRVAPTLHASKVDGGILVRHGYTRVEGSQGWASARVDLSEPIEVIRKNLQQKWRNCLNKSERMDINCEYGTDDGIIHEVLREYERMLTERKFTGSASPSLLIQLHYHLEENRKLWGIVARRHENILGGILIARYGNTSEYLVGAFTEEGRKLNASNLLLWRAISQMKAIGYSWFDLGGMHPVTTPKGIYHFKSGISGATYQLCGELESCRGGLINRAIRWRINRTQGSI